MNTREITPVQIAQRAMTSRAQVRNGPVASLAKRLRVANTTPANTGATPVVNYSAPTTFTAPAQMR